MLDIVERLLTHRQFTSVQIVDQEEAHGSFNCCTLCASDLVCDIINHDDAMSTPVVAARDRPKALLAGRAVGPVDPHLWNLSSSKRAETILPGLPGRIPDLQLYCLALQIEGANLEVHADRTWQTKIS